MDQTPSSRRPAPSRRSLLRAGSAALALPAVPALAGCGGDTGGETGDGTGEVKLLYMGDATQQKTFQSLFDEFQKSHPDVKIKANGIASGDWATFGNTVATRIAGGEVADVISVATEGQRLMSSKRLLEPLDQMIKDDEKDTKDFYDNVPPQLQEWIKTYGSPDGKTYFVPGGYNTVVMYLNRDVFEKAGVGLPQNEWTWDEFRAAAETIKEKTGAYIAGVGASFPFGQILPWLMTNGASTLDETWSKATFDTPQAIEAAQFVADLVKDELVPKPGGEFDAPTQYQRGALATLAGGRYALPDIRRLKMVDGTKVVNFPHKAQPGSPIGWDGWAIFKASKQKKAAWTFLKWLMTKEASEYYAKQGGTNVPVRTDVAQSDAFLEDAPEGTELIASAIEFATPVPSPDQQAQVDAEVDKGWEAAILGNKSAEDALKAANEAIQGVL